MKLLTSPAYTQAHDAAHSDSDPRLTAQTLINHHLMAAKGRRRRHWLYMTSLQCAGSRGSGSTDDRPVLSVILSGAECQNHGVAVLWGKTL